MRRLRTRLVFAFFVVALLAMIPVAIIPYYSFNLAKEEERHNDLQVEINKLTWEHSEFQNRIQRTVLNTSIQYLINNTFRTRTSIPQMMKTAEYPTSATVQAEINVYNNILWDLQTDSAKNYFNLEREDLSVKTLKEYENEIQPLFEEKRFIEEDNKVYQWIAGKLSYGTHRDNMEIVGVVVVKTLLFIKNIDDKDSEVFSEKKAQYLNNSPLEIINARPSLFQDHLPEDAMEKMFDFGGELDFKSVELKSVQLPFINNGAESHVILLPIVNQNGQATAFFVHSRPVVAVWIFSYPATQISFGITLLVILIIATIIARSIAAPLHRMASASHAMAQGNFDVRIEERGTEEQRIMSSAFNIMAERIQEQIGALNENTNQLETSNRELAQTQRFLENVLSGISTGVMSVDQEGFIRLINPAGCNVFGLENPSGTKVLDVIQAPAFTDFIKRALTTGSSIFEREITCAVDDETVLPLQVSALPMLENGEPTGLVVTFHDLSEIRKLEEQVRRQDRLASLGRMSAGVAHEIRNPLGIIRGSAQLLNKRFGDQAAEEGLTTFIIEEVNRLSRVVNDFLMFARPPEPVIDAVSAHDLAAQINAYTEPNDEGAVYSFETIVEPDLPPIAIDPALCKEAFLNLILNAQQAMPDGGAIQIHIKRWDGNTAAVEIKDQGSGISPEQIDRIFDPFYTSKDTGTGLGLSLVHQIISSHGGRVEVESIHGEGSLFRIILPFYSQQENESAGNIIS
ncbi:MAG: ATP-binding protein [Candidatus Hinthialibacter antarcticus]|nr:ATP-binding protein [Candidatus Hinthialibacter antarcticus]